MFERTTVPTSLVLTGEAALLHSFTSFIRFAVENPKTFTLMYDSELIHPQLVPEIATAQERALKLLQDEVHKIASHLSEHERSLRITTFWSAVLGYAIQSNRMIVRTYSLDHEPSKLAPQIVRHALRLLY